MPTSPTPTFHILNGGPRFACVLAEPALSWLATSDVYDDDPRIIALSPDAEVLHQRLARYCARRLTDGHFQAQAIVLVAAGKVRDIEAAIAELCTVNPFTGTALMEQSTAGWYLVDYLDQDPGSLFLQPPRDVVKERRAAAAERKREYRIRQKMSHGTTENQPSDEASSPTAATAPENGMSHVSHGTSEYEIEKCPTVRRVTSRALRDRATPTPTPTLNPVPTFLSLMTQVPTSSARTRRGSREMPERDVARRADQPFLFADLVDEVIGQLKAGKGRP